MSVELAPFPDVEVVLVHGLADLGDTGTETPAEFTGAIRILRTGGADDGFTDSPIVSITTYMPTRAESQTLTRQIQGRMLALPATVLDGVLIDNAFTYTGPIENPDQNPDIRAVTTYYVVEYRRSR